MMCLCQEDGWLQIFSRKKESLSQTEIEPRFLSFPVRSPNHYTHKATLLKLCRGKKKRHFVIEDFRGVTMLKMFLQGRLCRIT
jgi:hypothetical protein